MQIPITGGAYKNPTQDCNFQRCVNQYIIDKGPEGRGLTGPLIPRPGHTRIITNDNDTACRFLGSGLGVVLMVAGSNVYIAEVNIAAKSGSLTKIGELETSSGIVSGAYSQTQAMLVDGDNGYVFEGITYGIVTPGPIGGSSSDTYSLSINGTWIYINFPVDVALSLGDLVSAINAHTDETGVAASEDGTDVLLENVNVDALYSPIEISETGIGFTPGTDGLTISSGPWGSTPGSGYGVLWPLQRIKSPDFEGGRAVVFIQGYFIVLRPNTSILQASGLNDAFSWNALDVASADVAPDLGVGLATSRGELWVFGTNSVEIWDNTANPEGFPFSVLEGAGMDVGCYSQGSIAYLDNRVFWLDSRRKIVQSDSTNFIRNNSSGYSVTPVSTDAIDYEIANYVDLAESTAFQVVVSGHLMYAITFPRSNKTWVYDYNTQLWHEWNFYDPDSARDTYSLSIFGVDVQGKNIVAGNRFAHLYMLDTEAYTDDGQPIVRIRTSSVFHDESNIRTVNEIIMRIQTGYAQSSGDGSDPQIALRYSHDGGHTWSDWLPRSIGKIGEYAKVINWTRLGYSREWIVELKLAEPIPYAIIDCSAKIG